MDIIDILQTSVVIKNVVLKQIDAFDLNAGVFVFSLDIASLIIQENKKSAVLNLLIS